MGVPVDWALTSGTRPAPSCCSDYPPLLLATLAVIVATGLIGFVAARRRPSLSTPRVVLPAAGWFAAFATVSAIAIGHAPAIVFGGVAVDVNVSATLTFTVERAVGGREHDRRRADRPLRQREQFRGGATPGSSEAPVLSSSPVR